ncbi:MAG TPA: hypothetical protein VEQ17_12755 [Steroidobacteraceae bacterium]|nr:hypothetical protein [Steroidobacteraceae bacterium]
MHREVAASAKTAALGKVLASIAIAVAVLAPPAVRAADSAAPASSVPLDRSCDRACLYGVLDGYLAALRRKDPWMVKWTRDAVATENNVVMPVGEGHWGTLTKLEAYDLRMADPLTGQVAMFGALNEGGAISPFVVRLEVRDGAIRRAETLVRRKASDPRIMAEPAFEKKPVFDEVIPPQARLPRARLVSIADGYFDTLQLNDGTLFTQFDERCNRVENGVQTTNNPVLKELSVSLTMGCEQQFRMGYFRYDDRLRDRRITVVDEERGLVLGMAMMDHSGRLRSYKLTDGSTEESHYLAPHSYYLFELFKITPQGRIRQIEANFVTVPYYTATVTEMR